MQLIYSLDPVNELTKFASNLFINFSCNTRRSPKCTYESQALTHNNGENRENPGKIRVERGMKSHS